MNIILIFFSSVLVLIFINYFLKNKNWILNSRGDKHQIFFSSKNVPLIGGVVLIIFSLVYLNIENYKVLIPFILIFLVGLVSDMKVINSPIIRLFAQVIIIYLGIEILDTLIDYTGINVIDNLLLNKYFKICFTMFCILIVINGCNFIDGINISLTGYVLIVFIILKLLNMNGIILLSDLVNLDNLITVLVVILIFNTLNKIYLGDNGAYLLGMILSIYLIDVFFLNRNFSSFFIVNLLWYPSFEILFSIFRKIRFSRSPVKPDTNHLHQLIYSKIRKVNNFKNLSNIFINSATGFLIIIYNFFILLFLSNNIYDSQIQITTLIFNIFLYIFVYSKLINIKFKK